MEDTESLVQQNPRDRVVSLIEERRQASRQRFKKWKQQDRENKKQKRALRWAEYREVGFGGAIAKWREKRALRLPEKYESWKENIRTDFCKSFNELTRKEFPALLWHDVFEFTDEQFHELEKLVTDAAKRRRRLTYPFVAALATAPIIGWGIVYFALYHPGEDSFHGFRYLRMKRLYKKVFDKTEEEALAELREHYTQS